MDEFIIGLQEFIKSGDYEIEDLDNFDKKITFRYQVKSPIILIITFYLIKIIFIYFYIINLYIIEFQIYYDEISLSLKRIQFHSKIN